MSASSSNEGDITISQTKVTVTKTKVSDNTPDLDDLLIADLGKVGKSALKSLSGFRTFILRGNVVDLAIGIVIGAAFTAVVNAVVSDVITPLIPISGHSISGLVWHPPYAGKDAQGKPIMVDFGALINAVISFLIVAATLYFFVVQPVNKLMKLYKPKESGVHELQECPYCFQSINIKATRCPFCTSQIRTNGKHHGDNGENEPVLMLPESLDKLSEQLAEKLVRKTAALENSAAEEASESSAAKE